MSEAGDAVRLAELLCARISHDLSGTVGTLAGALELAMEDSSAAEEALSLAHQAAAELRHRLEVQRAAWGPESHPLDRDGLRALAAGLPHADRVTLDLSGLPDGTVYPPNIARLVVNLLLLAGDSLGGGGCVTIAGTARDVIVGIAGPRAAWPSGMPGCFGGEAAAWAAVRDARSLLLPLTALLARAAGLRLSPLLPAGLADGPPMLRLSEV